MTATGAAGTSTQVSVSATWPTDQPSLGWSWTASTGLASAMTVLPGGTGSSRAGCSGHGVATVTVASGGTRKRRILGHSSTITPDSKNTPAHIAMRTVQTAARIGITPA